MGVRRSDARRAVSVPSYTFKGNRQHGRHGWLRLTPAYSVQLVEELIGGVSRESRVLDPFCGSGTTALVCGVRGIRCETVDINPFLVWLSRAKSAIYTADHRAEAMAISAAAPVAGGGGEWRPPMHAIERWWDEATVTGLSTIRATIERGEISEAARDLLKVAFCRTLIERSRASFRHQSMSLQHDISPETRNTTTSQTPLYTAFSSHVRQVVESEPLTRPSNPPGVHLGDARRLDLIDRLRPDEQEFDVVITSPPYPNRMSYVREVRPYMYWLGYLQSAAEAGELDWQAIGGTWGRATSNLSSWQAAGELPLPRGPLTEAIEQITRRHPLLGRYVQKYVIDTHAHLESLRRIIAPGALVIYVVGNSRFFDTLLETELIYAELFAQIGLGGIQIERLRKRTSKRELFEFAVSARA